LARLQQAKHATSAKHFVNWDWSEFKCLDTIVIFQFHTTIVLILIVRNTKGPQVLTAKPVTAFTEFVYTVLLLS